jgi:hypothetical protein
VEIWSAGITVDDIWSYLELSGVLTLMVPTETMTAGDYVMTVTRPAVAEQPPVLQERFSVR